MPDSYFDRYRTDVDYTPRRSALPREGGEVPSVAQIVALVDRATAPDMISPDYALNLQIVDYVNARKGSAPREVAMHLARLASASHPRRNVLALALLDLCVKNGGYAFHLAVSRRDFLNALVRSFPTTPPMQYSRLQNMILSMLQHWDLGLVRHSRHREDLATIHEMVTLLRRKGYLFPDVVAEDVAALRPAEGDALRSAHELEAEDREAQSAKLQELIRSGSPEDLREANKLMSLMAGFRESRIDYHAKMAAELDKVRRKAELFAEMLQPYVDGSAPAAAAPRDDVLGELLQALKAAVPKIKHILADKETMDEDAEAHARILALQAEVEALLARYAAVQSGEAVPEAAGLASLIDIGDDEVTSTAAAGKAGASGGKAGTSSMSSASGGDDLLGLSLDGLNLGKPSTADILQLGKTSTPSTSVASTSVASTPVAAASTASDDPFGVFDTPAPAPAPAAATPATAPATPQAKELFSDDAIKVTYTVTRSGERTEITLRFANAGAKRISNLATQFAPPRSLTLELGALSATDVEARAAAAATQRVVLVGAAAPKLRWKAAFKFGLDAREAGGDLRNI